jgi:hypothetical protein
MSVTLGTLGESDIISGYHYHFSKIGQILSSYPDFSDPFPAVDPLDAKLIVDACSNTQQTDASGLDFRRLLELSSIFTMASNPDGKEHSHPSVVLLHFVHFVFHLPTHSHTHAHIRGLIFLFFKRVTGPDCALW